MTFTRLVPGTSRHALMIEPARRDDLLGAPAAGEGAAASGSKISGYGAVFYDSADPGTEYELWYDVVERIMPGAFDRAIREDDVRSFFNHDANFILGRTSAKTLELAIDAVGLRYSVTPSGSGIAQHALEAVQRGDVNGSSFMFEVGAATWVEQIAADGETLWIRQITEVRPLYEVGPVCFPAYESATSESNAAGGVVSLRTRTANGPAVERWQDWYQRHVTRARDSFDSFQIERGLLAMNDARSRRQRARRIFDLQQSLKSA